MPRKRATRAQTTHAAPKLQSSEDEESVQKMTKAQKKAKLDNLVQDFKFNYDNIRKQYDDVIKSGLLEIERRFHRMRCKLSPMELQMTIKEYIEYTSDQSRESENIAALPPRKPTVLTDVAETLNKYRSRQIIDTIPEEGGTSSSETATAKRPTRKKRATNKAGGVSFKPEPLSSVQNNFVTPAMPRTMSELGWGATPLVTPKFDPRLPVTPANARRWKPGEVAMSLAGSPLTLESEKESSKNKLIFNGEELEIPDEADIRSLMTTLQSIMKKTSEQN